MLDTLCRHFSSSQENVCCVSITHNSHSPLGSDETSDEHSLVSALFLRILFSMVPSGRGSWLDFKLAFFKSGGTLNSSVFWRAIETLASPTCTKTSDCSCLYHKKWLVCIDEIVKLDQVPANIRRAFGVELANFIMYRPNTNVICSGTTDCFRTMFDSSSSFLRVDCTSFTMLPPAES
eukprot:PhF_6_TR37333/c0_g2_i2/m.54980